MKKAVEDYGFNSFRLAFRSWIRRLYSPNPSSLNGFSEGDPRYEEALGRYLSGWAPFRRDRIIGRGIRLFL